MAILYSAKARLRSPLEWRPPFQFQAILMLQPFLGGNELADKPAASSFFNGVAAAETKLIRHPLLRMSGSSAWSANRVPE